MSNSEGSFTSRSFDDWIVSYNKLSLIHEQNKNKLFS